MATLQLFIDAHVHFYPCYDPLRFFQSAFRNTNSLAKQYNITSGTPRILCFTESKGYNYFSQWLALAQQGEPLAGFETKIISGLGPELIELRSASERLWLVPGRQINTDNGLEVSAFGLQEAIPDGGDLTSLVEKVLQTGAIPALPWGVGKWFGARGQQVQHCLERYSEMLGVSDNSNRPGFWPLPALLKSSASSNSMLAGSDPLPMTQGQNDVGRYGTILTASEPKDGQQVLDLLRPSTEIAKRVLGSRESGLRFLINQFSMQIRKRAAQ